MPRKRVTSKARTRGPLPFHAAWKLVCGWREPTSPGEWERSPWATLEDCREAWTYHRADDFFMSMRAKRQRRGEDRPLWADKIFGFEKLHRDYERRYAAWLGEEKDTYDAL